MDIQIDVPAVTPADLALPPALEGSAEVAERVARARTVQHERNGGMINAHLPTSLLDHIAEPDREGRDLLTQAAQSLGLTARGYHRVLRLARTLADLSGSPAIRRLHIAEALSYRRSAGASARPIPKAYAQKQPRRSSSSAASPTKTQQGAYGRFRGDP